MFLKISQHFSAFLTFFFGHLRHITAQLVMQWFPDLASSPDRKVLAWLADKAISPEAKEELLSMAKATGGG